MVPYSNKKQLFNYRVLQYLKTNNESENDIKLFIKQLKQNKIDSKEKLKFALLTNRLNSYTKVKLISFCL